MKKISTLPMLLLCIASCSDKLEELNENLTENHPASVSKAFWNMHFTKPNESIKFIMDTENFSTRFHPKKDQNVQLGEVMEKDNLYFINSIYSYTENQTTQQLHFLTVVGSKDGKFKVKYNESLNSFFTASIEKHSNELIDELSAIDSSVINSLPNESKDISHEYAKWAIEQITYSLSTQNISLNK